MFRRHLILAAVALLSAPVALSAQASRGAGAQFGAQTRFAPPYQNGYTRGVQAGEDDVRRGDRFAFNDESDYRNADYGYRSQFGQRDQYRVEFRRGFEAGYAAGYRPIGQGRFGRGNVGTWSGLPGAIRFDPAARQGFDDGYAAGLDDGRDRRRFDPIAESRYRSGDRGYERGYGSRDLYKANYREGFRRGYEDGFQDAGRYGYDYPR